MSFVGIQASHRVPVRGGMPMPVRTGMENVIAHQVDENFAYVAEDDGTIKEKTRKYVIVQYKDGSTKTVKLGIKVASSKGNYYRHDLVCDLDVGAKVTKGQVVMFNQAFFIRDVFNMKQVVPIDRVIARTVLMENNDTFEDSSCISDEFSAQLEMKSVKEKMIIINATDKLSNVSKLDEIVEVNTPLCFIEDSVFDGAGDKFSKQSIELLKKMARMAPKAGVKGKIIKREVMYFCEEDDMSQTVKDVVNEITSEGLAGEKMKLADKRALSGKINQPLKFGSQLLGPGKVGIRYFIESSLGCTAGDKVVFKMSGHVKAI